MRCGGGRYVLLIEVIEIFSRRLGETSASGEGARTNRPWCSLRFHTSRAFVIYRPRPPPSSAPRPQSPSISKPISNTFVDFRSTSTQPPQWFPTLGECPRSSLAPAQAAPARLMAISSSLPALQASLSSSSTTNTANPMTAAPCMP